MPDFDISGQHHHHQQYNVGDKEKGNISIKHTTGHHTQNVTQRDMIQASTSTFKEEYVPPVDTPVLEAYDQNASNDPPQPKPEKPGAKFKNNFENELQHLPPSVLKSIASTPHEARAMLRFAHANPDVPMDPKVRALLKTIVKEAAQETREAMNLGSDWQPPEPHTGEFNAHISDKLNSNFESQLKENFSGSDYKSLRLAYYHPELRSQLSPELQDYLNEMTQTAYDETQSDMGFPEGWQPPPDSSSLDDIMNGHFTHTFDEEVAKQTQLSPKERKELRTLFRFPNAKVPDKEKLQDLLKSLTDKAHASAKERFGLPSHFKLNHQSHLFKASMQGSFGHQFQKEVLKKLRNGEISHAQAQKLLASKGTDPAKVPSNLQNVYTQARQTAAKQTANEMGLPDNWQPTEETSEPAPGETSGSTATTQQETVRNADGSVRVKANTPVQGKGLQSQQSQPIDPLTAPASNRDTNTALKAINYFKQAVTATSKITANYFTGPEHMYLGDSMLVVSDALDNLRESVYSIQVAESNASRAVMRGQNDAQEEKIRKELADMMKPPPKTFFLFKILRIIPIVKEFANKIEDAIKLLMWAVNIVTGGAVSMITQAIGMQPIEENPLQMMGLISEEAAQKMDMALGIIVMVAEMAVSAVLAQPELVAAEVAGLTAELSVETAGEVAAAVTEATVEATTEVAARAAAPAVGEAVAISSEIVTRATANAIERAMPKILEKVVEEGVKASAKQAAKQSLKQTIQQQARTFALKILRKAKDVAVREARQQVTKLENLKTTGQKIVENPMGFVQEQVQELQDLGNMFGKGGNKIGKVGKVDGAGMEGAETAERAATPAEETANVNKATSNVNKAKKGPPGKTEAKTPDAADPNASDPTVSEQEVKAQEKGPEEQKPGGEPEEASSTGGGTEGTDGNYGETTMTEREAPAEPTPENEPKPDKPIDEKKPTEQDTLEENQTPPEDENVQGEQGAEQGGKDIDPEMQNKMDAAKMAKMKKAYTEEFKQAFKDAVEKRVNKQLAEKNIKVNQAKRPGFTEAMTKATEGKEGFSKAKTGLETAKNWVETEVKETVKTGFKKVAETTKMDKAAEKAQEGVDKVKGKLNETKAGKAIGKVASSIGERLSSADDLAKQAAKELEKGDVKAFQRKLLKASAKRIVERQQANFRFMLDVKNYIQDTIQFASYTAQTIMFFKKAKAEMKAAENQAFIQEMDAYIEMDKKAEDALMQSMGELAGWINDINQQESTFWKKMEIRFIAA